MYITLNSAGESNHGNFFCYSRNGALVIQPNSEVAVIALNYKVDEANQDDEKMVGLVIDELNCKSEQMSNNSASSGIHPAIFWFMWCRKAFSQSPATSAVEDEFLNQPATPIYQRLENTEKLNLSQLSVRFIDIIGDKVAEASFQSYTEVILDIRPSTH